MAPARAPLVTLVALGVLAFSLKAVTHEAVGHGGASALMGCVPGAVSSSTWRGDCDAVADPALARAIVNAGGTAANLLLGALAALGLLALRARREALGTWAYFLWLVMVTNLLSGGGYLMVDPVFGFGDWTGFMENLAAPHLRWGLAGAGLALSVGALLLGKWLLLPWLGDDIATRRRRSRWLCLVPYLAGGAIVPLSALLNREGSIYGATSALSTFGGCAWLVWIGFDPLVRAREPRVGALDSSRVAVGLAVAVSLALFLILGPGIVF